MWWEITSVSLLVTSLALLILEDSKLRKRLRDSREYLKKIQDETDRYIEDNKRLQKKLEEFKER